MSIRRVVVTGLGMISPVGLTVESAWQNILEGKSGVSTIQSFDASPYASQICATSSDAFNPSDFNISQQDARRMDLFIQFGIAAAEQAIKDAGIDTHNIDQTRMGVAVGSGIGGLPMLAMSHKKLLDFGPKKVSPFFIPAVITNMVAGHISMRNHLKGPNISIVTACTTGTHNIGEAARMIKYGDADIMVAGGAEMATNELGIAGFAACRALSCRNAEPQKASRPWDKDRDGFVLGDGAGVLILEEYEHAKARGAKIYAELAGFGMSADAYHITVPDETGAGAISCMTNAIRDAKLDLSDIDYINAHGTSTPIGDKLEAKAIQKLFGSHAYDLAVSSTKSMTGHLLGAAGAVEAIFSVLSIRDQVAPPTINLDNPDDGCDLNFVPHHAQERSIQVALSNSFGFGGTNGCLIFRAL